MLDYSTEVKRDRKIFIHNSRRRGENESEEGEHQYLNRQRIDKKKKKKTIMDERYQFETQEVKQVPERNMQEDVSNPGTS